MNNWGYRKPRKQFITFENLIAWGLQLDEDDPKWGKYYNQARHLFTEAVKLFNGTYTYEKLKDDGTIETVHYPNLNITEEDLFNHYLEEYRSRLCARPVEVGRISLVNGQPMDLDNALSVVMDITYSKTQRFVLFNRYKYLGLVKTTGFLYNPIENYRMVEKGSDTVDYKGSESNERTIEDAKIQGWKVNGPATDFTKDNNNNITGLSIDFAHVHKKAEAGNNLSTSQAGTGITGVSGANASTTTSGSTTTMSANPGTVSYSSTPADLPTNRNYTTTYDKADENRLKDYSTSSGRSSNAAQTTSQSVEDETTYGEVWGGSSAQPFKDTKSFTDRKDSKDHELTRSGNIGVTTSQQMIESERELVRFNVIDEFCKELNKEILLSVWN